MKNQDEDKHEINIHKLFYSFFSTKCLIQFELNYILLIINA